MDPGEVDELWTALRSVPHEWWDWHLANGWYAPALAVPHDAPFQDRMLGLISRDPRWEPPT